MVAGSEERRPRLAVRLGGVRQQAWGHEHDCATLVPFGRRMDAVLAPQARGAKA
ncbi:MAG: hypothetical protein IIT36_04500 [Aeriscardovia sp.]|nr:hypothetical protein [Aeriscardovia sp.]